ncbi:hypothetical protein [Phytohabitans houttuyneae]|nr:hypothetical protein [Phytohabitans houttuyneae]
MGEDVEEHLEVGVVAEVAGAARASVVLGTFLMRLASLTIAAVSVVR